jgi:hypothetical protein
MINLNSEESVSVKQNTPRLLRISVQSNQVKQET